MRHRGGVEGGRSLLSMITLFKRGNVTTEIFIGIVETVQSVVKDGSMTYSRYKPRAAFSKVPRKILGKLLSLVLLLLLLLLLLHSFLLLR